MRIAYLFSRYPVVSQTFVDTEMLALERAGVELEIFSVYPPHTSFRHGHAAKLKAPIHYAPSQSILKLGEQEARRSGRWPAELIAAHDRKYGTQYKAALRARNALYFADLFRERGFTHFHVHFANRAAHTALFLKAISGIPFSMSTHGQDYMVDLGNHDLLREICSEAVFVANETEWSTGELRRLCPNSNGKMVRVFNGMNLANFVQAEPGTKNIVPRIITTGRLIEFKGFHHLIAACAQLRDRGLAFECEIVGEGPWRAQLQQSIDDARLAEQVKLTGALPQEEVFAKTRAADIFTLPCIVDVNGASDVFPTVILEAMASARPVVSTRLAGVPEQIVNGETGYICEPGDVACLADSLEKLLRSAELRQKFGEAGQRRIREEFAVDNTVRALHAQYEKYVAPAPAPAPRNAGLAVLLNEWPTNERHETELRQLAEQYPAYRGYVVHAASTAASEQWRQTLPHLEFLPDAMVMEAEWQQQDDLRHRIETWRSELGAKITTEDYLRHARYALSLTSWVKRDAVRHVHAACSRELLTVWLLHRLCGVTFSATLEEKPQLHDDVIARIAENAAGLRIANERVHTALAAHFKNKTTPYLAQRTSRNFEPEWLARLKRCASSNL